MVRFYIFGVVGLVYVDFFYRKFRGFGVVGLFRRVVVVVDFRVVRRAGAFEGRGFGYIRVVGLVWISGWKGYVVGMV